MSLLRTLSRPLLAASRLAYSSTPSASIALLQQANSLRSSILSQTQSFSLLCSSNTSTIPTLNTNSTNGVMRTTGEQIRNYTMPKGARKLFGKSVLSRKTNKTARRNSARMARKRSKRRGQIN